EKAAKELGWRAELGIDEMCADSYLFQRNHPDGYEE
ncbi:MAG: UDP-glucose 4-epimerase, partial [Clostridia bacterium]